MRRVTGGPSRLTKSGLALCMGIESVGAEMRLPLCARQPQWKRIGGLGVEKARPAAVALPEIFGAGVARRMLKPRGRPKTGTARTAISIRLPPETLARWKATGAGWQTRMVEVLDKAVSGKP
jgi:uncharacterized protein (DUF4415 family)